MAVPQIEILNPGLSTSVQDFGREDLAHLGIPAAGAMDRDGMVIANALVGNSPQTAVLECLQVGPTFRVATDQITIALACRGRLLITGETTRVIPTLQSATAKRGEVVTVKDIRGASYLAFGGGLDLAPVMGSQATYGRGRFGGYQGRPLRDGDVIPLVGQIEPRPSLLLPMTRALEGRLLSKTLRAVPGPQTEYFTRNAQAGFFAKPYRITQASDRMGTRLEGLGLSHSKLGFNIPSDAIAFGSVQVPGDGQPIVLGRDRQTTGGYPKIATVLSPDMARLARLNPGDQITFAAVEKPEAEAIYREHMTWLGRINQSFVASEPGDQAIDMEALWSENLISGVVGPEQ